MRIKQMKVLVLSVALSMGIVPSAALAVPNEANDSTGNEIAIEQTNADAESLSNEKQNDMSLSQQSVGTEEQPEMIAQDEAGPIQDEIDPIDISKATVDAISDQPFTGKPIEPKVAVKLGDVELIADTDYVIDYTNNIEEGVGTVTITGNGNYTGSLNASFKIVKPTVQYKVHVQSYGDQEWRSNGKSAGTSNESKRLEGIWMKLDDAFPVSGGIRYQTHVQSYGWENDWKTDGGMSGTSGESKRLEAIRIELTGDVKDYYDVYYRVHAQRLGWMGWAKNGAEAGTAGMSWRLEAIQVVLVPKDNQQPGDVEGIQSAIDTPYFQRTDVAYHTHVQTYGWEQEWRKNGESSGTSGEAKRLEGLEIRLENGNLEGSIEYRSHVQTYGWEEDWRRDGDTSGTEGESKRLEAMQIQLTGQVADYYDVWYRVHSQTLGWLGWATNGEEAGTAGASKRLEALEVVLLPKGSDAPGSTFNHYVEGMRQVTIEKYLATAYEIAADDSHGYSQENRWGPDYDCSSYVITCLRSAGLETGLAERTANMRQELTKYGWNATAFTSMDTLERGDILLTPVNHTEFYIGDGKNIRAGTGNGITGDQSNEIGIREFHMNGTHGWMYVLRLS